MQEETLPSLGPLQTQPLSVLGESARLAIDTVPLVLILRRIM